MAVLLVEVALVGAPDAGCGLVEAGHAGLVALLALVLGCIVEEALLVAPLVYVKLSGVV